MKAGEMAYQERTRMRKMTMLMPRKKSQRKISFKKVCLEVQRASLPSEIIQAALLEHLSKFVSTLIHKYK